MKRTLLTLAIVGLSALTMYGQGRVAFNNYVSGNAITIVAAGDPLLQAAAGQGANSANLGANYSVQLLWAPQGTYADTAAFLAAMLGSSGPIAFFGTTGGSPGTDGAGLFDGATVPNPVGTSMPAGTYTMAARAWFNGGANATYDAARAANANTGWSAFFNVAATVSPATPNNTIFPSFVVGTPIPEPSTFVLAGLGIASLLLFRRRK
jgi:hypothetical protein